MFDELEEIPQAPAPMQFTRILFPIALAVAWTVQAQNPAPNVREITLQEAIQMALEHNLDVKIQAINPRIAELNLKASYAMYEPTLSFAAVHNFSSQPTGVVDPQGRIVVGSREIATDSFPLGLNTSVGSQLPTGLRYSISERLSHTAIDQTGVPTVDNYNASWTLDLRQPLLRNFWIDPDRAQIQVNKKALKLSEVALKGLIITTVAQVEQAYYNLISARENVKVAEKGLELAERTLLENRKKVEVGALAPLDEKQAEAQVATSKAGLIATQRALDFQENALKSLLTDNYASFHDTTLIPAEKLLPLPMSYNLQESWQKGLAVRPDLLQAKLDLERQDITLRLQKNQLLPSLDAFFSYGLSGTRNTSYSDVLSDLTRDRNPAYTYGGSLTIPLGNIAARNRYKATRSLKEQAVLQLKKLEQDIMIQIDDAIKAAQSAFERVRATREAREFAETALDAEQKKLENGKSTTFQVLQLQRDLTQAAFNEIGALAEYNNALAQLALREGTTLERHRLSVNLK
ncbi:MAG: TolC family protein [Verrucomicrobia bacterium]|nr:TolC family protein [Verrucomicrobiota bacterium]